MKVALKDLKPNPFRDIKNYPIDENKVEQLRKSIRKTGFWDNLVVREGEGIELAYGHHRILALRKEFKPAHEISVIIKDLDDKDMIRVMADENDEYYGTSPAIINETVRVARDYLEKHPEHRASGRTSYSDKYHREFEDIAKFLQWEDKKQRIKEALATFSDVTNGDIDRHAYESLPSQTQATVFRKAVKKHKLDNGQQKQLAKRIVKEEIGKRNIEATILDEKYPDIKKPPKEINDFLYEDMLPLLKKVNNRLKEVIKFKKFIKGGEGLLFMRECKMVKENLEDLLKRGD